jgi:hypothetical protein
VTTTVEEFRRDVVGDTSDDASPEALVLPSGLMSSGKTTTVDDVIEYLEDSEVDEEISRYESDDFRWEMLERGIVPKSWEKEEYPDDATLEQGVEWTSESEESSEHDIDWGAEIDEVVPRDEVYEMLGSWTLNSEGVALYDGSNDRNHPLIRKAAKLDSDVTVPVQPVADDAWRRYVEDWGGDTEELFEEVRRFADIYGDMLEGHLGSERVEDLRNLGEGTCAPENGGEDFPISLMQDISNIMNRPGRYQGRYADSEKFNSRVESMKRYSGRLGEFAENIQQQHETIKLAEDLDGVEAYYIDDITGEGKNRYGRRVRHADGSAEDLGRKLERELT